MLGVLLGLVAGYRGGWLETVVMRVVDVVVAFPFIVLVIAVIAIVGPGLPGVYIGVTVVGWALYARLTRAEMLVLKEQQFMLAGDEPRLLARARSSSATLLPNVLRPNLVFSTLDIVLNILLLASLSFLGLGVQPPTAEWGLMVADGQTFLLTAWWISTLPGLVIVLAGVGFSLVGDGLADRLGQRLARPRRRERGDDPRRRRGARVTASAGAARGAAARGRDLHTAFAGAAGAALAAAGVSFSLGEGETKGLVGESGSGKSVTLLSLLGLVPQPGRVSPARCAGTAATCSRLAAGRAARDPRPRDRDDLPGPDQLPEPGLHDRRPDRRDAAA